MKKETDPWKPYITLEQIYAFDPMKPETSTGSPFVDKILRMFFNPEISLGTNVGCYLELDPHYITGYLVVATGYKLGELRKLWTKHRVELFKKINPGITQTQMAQTLGYKDPSSMWRFLNAEEQTRKQRQQRQEISDSTWRNHWKGIEELEK